MIVILKNILKFITDPKNTRMLLFAGIVIMIFLLLHQCNKTQGLKDEIEREKKEAARVENNYKASLDTIKQYKVDKNTWRAEKSGYKLKYEELEGEYSDLLGDFELEKNKPPKVVVKTEFVIKDSIRNIPVIVGVDDDGNEYLKFSDSAYYDTLNRNFRIITGKIPYELVFFESDSSYHLIPDKAAVNLDLGMNLNLGLFEDSETNKIGIKVDTDYPSVLFTDINGAYIIDNPDNKKILRKLRKPFGFSLNLGYGIVYDMSSGSFGTGPYFGVGISYSPKILQWGK